MVLLVLKKGFVHRMQVLNRRKNESLSSSGVHVEICRTANLYQQEMNKWDEICIARIDCFQCALALHLHATLISKLVLPSSADT